MRQLRHPGPVAAERASVVAGTPVRLRFDLPPGETVEQAVARGFRRVGCAGGYIAFQGGACQPFQYVIPARSPDGRHVAWYSDVIAPEGRVAIGPCGASVGRRDGAPFIHCHGVWETEAGRAMGHMLAGQSVVSEPVSATGIGFADATFESAEDPETHFTLFGPVGIGAATAQAPSALLVRLRPNEEVSLAIEAICTSHGIAEADIFGIGSLNEVVFADERRVASHATEVLIRRGGIAVTEAGPRATLDIAVVDMQGGICEGTLRRGDNPVCVTFELVILPKR